MRGAYPIRNTAPKFVQVWHCQSMKTPEFERLEKEGANYLTAERMETMLNQASEAGFEAGKIQGRVELRVELREDIEAGDIPPIQKEEAATTE